MEGKKATLAELKGSTSLLTPPHLMSSPPPSSTSFPFWKKKRQKNKKQRLSVCDLRDEWGCVASVLQDHPSSTLQTQPTLSRLSALDVSNNPDPLLHTQTLRPAPSSATGAAGWRHVKGDVFICQVFCFEIRRWLLEVKWMKLLHKERNQAILLRTGSGVHWKTSLNNYSSRNDLL